MKNNIVLIGPPGAGKSTVGVLLAKALSKPFVDTDIIIQAAQGRRLQDIIDSEGMDSFCEIEAQCILQLGIQNYVIATGGSVVYSPAAMAHLKANGIIIFLSLPCEELLARIEDSLDSRGVVLAESQTFVEMCAERLPLYRRYADFDLNCSGFNHEQVVRSLIMLLGADS